ncbi:MAG: ABC transporter permease [Chitinivibrionales bacterium]|nr:ABC transporter permease [Chitinivibrionales bacterium]
MSTLDMNLADLALVYTILVVPIMVMTIYQTRQVKKTVVGIIRMSVQLFLVGIYLRYIFELNNPFVNGAWLVIMISVATANVLATASLNKKRLFPFIFIGIFLSTIGMLTLFVFGAITPRPLYDARYMIPIGGMLLGNCMRGNVISLERFLSGIRNNRKEYMSSLFMGATTAEAGKPWVRRALSAALAPTISTMATMGIVSLPGMMTGQILGGAHPMTAIKYQLAIMISIFAATSLSAWLNLFLCTRVAFDDYGMLREDIFK